MPTHVESDISVNRFAFTSDAEGNRLQFPHAETRQVEGRSGSMRYGASECVLEALVGRLSTVQWTADAASIGAGWLRDDHGRVEVVAERIEMPRGVMLTRGETGLEIISPHVSLSEVRMTLKDPFERSAPSKTPSGSGAAMRPLRQSRLKFLDSLSGRIAVTIKVVLDLPVLGKRTLDQKLDVPIKDGSLDFRALEDSLDWLEGAFLDIAHDQGRLAVRWKVPIFGSKHDLISWQLEQDADALAAFGRVPVRALADYTLGDGDDEPEDKDDKESRVKAFCLDGIDVAMKLTAPRSLDVGGGLIMFGGDDAPGVTDLKVTGSLTDSGPGKLRGSIGTVDTTIKDLALGPVHLTADRLRIDGIDQIEVTFENFKPTNITVVIHRVTASNLAIAIPRAE
ncbi:MAG: hypothetical protein AB7O24_24930 [Kofleriaceae bacterium]